MPRTAVAHPVNILIDGDMEAINAAVALVDGDMEAAGTGAWTSVGGTLTKEVASPHSGTQNLRVTGGLNVYAAQTVLTAGRVYRIQGWARGDGANGIPYLVGLSNEFVGTSSNTWQHFDITGTAALTYFLLYQHYNGSAYVEWDDITITDVTAGAYSVANCLASKSTTNPHSGTRSLRLAYDGFHTGGTAFQTGLLVLGRPYLLQGWYRTDGTTTVSVYAGTTNGFVGSSSPTSWTRFSVVALDVGDTIVRLQGLGLSAGAWVEFDDVQIIDLNATPIRVSASPYPVVNKLVDGDMEATNAAPAATDLDMEAADTSAWTASTATLSKLAGARTGGTGARIMRVAANGNTSGYASQANGLIQNHVYHMTGWARGDGANAVPAVYGGGTNYFTGTSSNTWQYFDVVKTQLTNNSLNPYGTFPGSVGYVEFDDITITDVTAGAYTPLNSGFAYKVAGSRPGGQGSQFLRVMYGSGATWGVGQGILAAGKPFLVTGWARGDGSMNPRIMLGGARFDWTGTASTAWQFFSFEGIATGGNLYLTGYFGSAANYVDFDDIQVIDLTATPARQPVTQTQNLLTYSEQFDNAIWSKNNSAAALFADYEPDGTQLWSMTGSSANNVEFIQAFSGAPYNQIYTITADLKAGTNGTAMIGDGISILANFNLATGAPAAGDTGPVIYKRMIALGNGVNRCSVTGMFTAHSVNIYNGLNDGSANGKTILVGKVWVNEGNAVSPYAKAIASPINLNSPIRNQASPVPVVNKLVDGNMEATNAAVALVDGNMEAAGYAAWNANNVTLSKDTTLPHTGTQDLHVISTGGTCSARQTILTIGHVYTVSVWARTLSGTHAPQVFDYSGPVWGTISVSAGWQQITATVVAGDTKLGLGNTASSVGDIWEFDDMTITDVTAGSWLGTNGSTVFKVTNNPHSGGQALRVRANVNTGDFYPQVQQAGETVVGKPYLLTGWGRSDGTQLPAAVSGGLLLFQGTNSTSWQRIKAYFIAQTTVVPLYFSVHNPTGTEYVDFDDMQLIDLTATPVRQPII